MVNPDGGYFPEPGGVWGELSQSSGSSWRAQGALGELWEISGRALGELWELWACKLQCEVWGVLLGMFGITGLSQKPSAMSGMDFILGMYTAM